MDPRSSQRSRGAIHLKQMDAPAIPRRQIHLGGLHILQWRAERAYISDEFPPHVSLSVNRWQLDRQQSARHCSGRGFQKQTAGRWSGCHGWKECSQGYAPSHKGIAHKPHNSVFSTRTMQHSLRDLHRLSRPFVLGGTAPRRHWPNVKAPRPAALDLPRPPDSRDRALSESTVLDAVPTRVTLEQSASWLASL